MGRRGNMKGRPGLLFIFFICICLVIFYFSWQMLLSPKFDQKGRNSVIHESGSLSRSGGLGWKPRHQFEDLQPNQQPPYMVGENQIRMPEHAVYGSENKKMSNVGQNDNDKSFQRFRDKEESEANADPGSSELQQPQTFIVNENNFFLSPISSIQDSVKTMERLVHLDFKGAVPSMKYLKEIIPLFGNLGATGLLVEYEDIFPFSGFLAPIRAKTAFDKDQLDEFLRTAKENNLKVMPLIQTFGHMEFVLKSAFYEFRESSYTPQVIDMTNDRSYKVISAIVQQVLDSHPDATHLHIGCDEVYELGKGASATMMQEKKLTVDQMFLRHVQRVADIVASYKDRKVIPVMWDDMLRKISTEDIGASSLPSQVEIMVWHYTPNVTGKIGTETFAKYSKLFKSIWIASSFKGATGSRQFYTEPLYHIQNQFSWLRVIEQHHGSLKFKGVALTGWQRYDHFATLCELLPVALPSLAVCLATLKNAGFTKEIYESTSELLKCDDGIEITFPKIDKQTKLAIITQDCSFPGSNIYYAMQDFYAYTIIPIQGRLDGWLSDYQVRHGFSNPGQLKVSAMDLNKQNNGYTKSAGPLKLHLSSIFSSEDVEEWLEENIYEKKRRNSEILDKVNGLLKMKVWEQRPLPILKVEKPNNPLFWSKSNTTKRGSDSRMRKDNQVQADQRIDRSKTIMDKSDVKKREDVGFRPSYTFRNPKDDERLSQDPNAPDGKVIGGIKSGSSDMDQRFLSKAERSHSKSEVYEKKNILSHKINNDNVRFSKNEFGQIQSISKDQANQDGPSYDIGRKRTGQAVPMNKKPESQYDILDRSGVKKLDFQDQFSTNRKVGGNKKYIYDEKLKQKENQMNEKFQYIRDPSQSQSSNRIVEADIPLNERQEFRGIGKKSQSYSGKADRSDFHDAKMKNYEENLLEAANNQS